MNIVKKIVFSAAFSVAALLCAHGVFAEDMVGVGLKFDSSRATECTFSSEYPLNFYNAATGEVLYTSSAGESVRVNIVAGFSSEGKFAAAIEKLSVQSTNKAPITYDSKNYRGYFLVCSDGTVINYIHTDQYLYSVLGKEMSPSFPAEALKAQAICAKNFIYGEKNRHNGFDVCATTHCQVYAGVSSEYPQTIAATDAVSGKMAYYNSKIVPLYFFATSGGKTEDVKNVWGSSIAYLKSVDDPYEPADKASHYTWETVISGEELGQRLGLGVVKDVRINSTSASGRVTSITFTGTLGTKTYTNAKCRSSVGTDKLYSQWFTVSSSVPFYEVALTSDGAEAVAGDWVLTADGKTTLSSGEVEFTFSGRGYGHGVGMSQWGAYGMAKEGYTYEEILRHYFTGIEIK